ncbi:GAF domain-containing protein [Mycolicibacterium moriokaense]|nr:GAF domain-containing protein [Mycolicibacterium moriokaense]
MSDVTVAVYRAPMRSRRSDVDFGATIERARALGLCGFGSGGSSAGRLARRIERFRDVENGSFVWTRDPDGLYWLGRIHGPYFHDDDAAAVAVDLVHVRECLWLPEPLLEPNVPAAVVATFGRGGRNFQQTHDGTVSAESQALWDEFS